MFVELKKWRQEAATQLWTDEGLALAYIKTAPNNIIMPDDCVLALAKNADDLITLESLTDFLKPWYGITDRFGESILACLEKTVIPTTIDASTNPTSTSASSSHTIPSRLEQKAMLKAARASKKLRYLDDPVIAAASEVIARRDEWLVKRQIHPSNKGSNEEGS